MTKQNEMKIFLCLVILIVSASANAQNRYIQLSSGYILFGTGDVQGYSFKAAYAKNILKNAKSRLYIGPELCFENGVQTPKMLNPTREEFLYGPQFYHITNTILSAKASYYPLRRIISGFHLVGGVSVGYSNQSTESQADLITLSNGDRIRRSYLQIDNGIIYGYRIGSGYEFRLTRKFSTGIFIELHNYSNNDFNSFWGGNIAWHF